MQRALRLLAALLVIAVMHNSVSASPIAPEPVKEATGHAHHGHDDAKDAKDAKDCCASGACECGCASTPPAAVFRPAPTAHDWGRIAAVRADDGPGYLPGFSGAPFRPPA